MINPRKLFILSSTVLGVLLVSALVNTALQTLQNGVEEVSEHPSENNVADLSQVIGESVEKIDDLQKVVKVIDGDTIHLENGSVVRYIGIDTPETVDPRKSVQCFGKEASNENKKLVEGRLVRLEKDISEIDKYGRLLRYVWVIDDSGQEIFVNDYLVHEGFARSSSYPPDVKYQDQFRESERQAREENKGLWENCPSN